MREFSRENPALKEQRTPEDVLKTFSTAERKAFYLMTPDEIKYLRDNCYISKYINYLRKGKVNKAIGSDFPILVVRGTELQLERFKVVFLLSLIDYQGVAYYYPADFSLNSTVMEDAKKFTGVAIIKIVKGTSTSIGLDEHRSELIAGVLANRRDNFNPTIILAEDKMAGKLSATTDMVKYIRLDQKYLRGTYDGSIVEVSEAVSSRETAPKTIYVQQPVYQNNSNNSYKSTAQQYKNKGKETVQDLQATSTSRFIDWQSE